MSSNAELVIWFSLVLMGCGRFIPITFTTLFITVGEPADCDLSVLQCDYPSGKNASHCDEAWRYILLGRSYDQSVHVSLMRLCNVCMVWDIPASCWLR